MPYLGADAFQLDVVVECPMVKSGGWWWIGALYFEQGYSSFVLRVQNSTLYENRRNLEIRTYTLRENMAACRLRFTFGFYCCNAFYAGTET